MALRHDRMRPILGGLHQITLAAIVGARHG
jgi:hypothetical protein